MAFARANWGEISILFISFAPIVLGARVAQADRCLLAGRAPAEGHTRLRGLNGAPFIIARTTGRKTATKEQQAAGKQVNLRLICY